MPHAGCRGLIFGFGRVTVRKDEALLLHSKCMIGRLVLAAAAATGHDNW